MVGMAIVLVNENGSRKRANKAEARNPVKFSFVLRSEMQEARYLTYCKKKEKILKFSCLVRHSVNF